MFSNVLKHLNMKFVIIILLVILLIMIMMYLYNKYFSKSPSYVANREFIKTSKSDKPLPPHPPHDEKPKKYAYLKLFCVKWCPYCNKLLQSGVYDEFYKENYKKEINGYTLLINKLDCTDENDPIMQKAISDYNITGFPTIKLEKDGKNNPDDAIDFDADPTLENLNKFVHTAL